MATEPLNLSRQLKSKSRSFVSDQSVWTLYLNVSHLLPQVDQLHIVSSMKQLLLRLAVAFFLTERCWLDISIRFFT